MMTDQSGIRDAENRDAESPDAERLNDESLNQNLYALFERQTRRRPEATAVIDRSGSATSYSELENRAGRIAAELAGQGLGDEEPIGVLMHRSTELVATLLGVLKAGCCNVPLDPDDPFERAGKMIIDAECRVVLGNSDLLEKLRSVLGSSTLAAEGVVLLDVEGISDEETGDDNAPHPSVRAGHRLAYILFTSGSTGNPKGVEVEHRSVINLLLAARDLLGFTESDRYLATSTVGFDISVAELFLPLITGGSVVVHDRRLVLEPGYLTAEIQRHAVTVFQTGPSVWSVLLDEVADFPRLRVAISTGEAIHPDLARRLVDVGETAWNLYGPTEATVWATGHRLGSEDTNRTAQSSVSAPIGRPLANVDVRVLDDERMPVPAGTKGELWIGGAALARGYRNNDSLTRERFAELESNGPRFYRTGDIVVEDDGGTLHYFGRNDDQIKVRGVRIEPMEVESAILSHPKIAQAAATWYVNASGSRSIVSAIVFKPDASVSKEELHQFLSNVLPAAMVPSQFEFYDELPLTPAGKVDRNAIRNRAPEIHPDTEALPEPGTVLDSQAIKDSQAVSETERTLIRIWENTLGVTQVGRTDHFFSIGGDSLSAIRVKLQVEDVFEISVSVRVLFESPTLNELAEHIDRERVQPDESGNSRFIFPLTETSGRTAVFFCSVDLKMARKGLWTADCPLYAVSLWAQGSGFVKAKSIEELTRSHIESIRSLQPHGPYRLAGYSFGGMIALEIARQLRQAGEEIELLFLLDPSEPFQTGGTLSDKDYAATDTGAYETLGYRIMHHGLNIARRPLDIVSYIGQRRSRFPMWPWICYNLVHLHGRNSNRLSALLLPKNRWPAFWYALRRLGKSYVARPYHGNVSAVFMDRNRQLALWKPLLGEDADISFVDSGHLDLFSEPALSQWQAKLQQNLKAVSN